MGAASSRNLIYIFFFSFCSSFESHGTHRKPSTRKFYLSNDILDSSSTFRILGTHRNFEYSEEQERIENKCQIWDIFRLHGVHRNLDWLKKTKTLKRYTWSVWLKKSNYNKDHDCLIKISMLKISLKFNFKINFNFLEHSSATTSIRFIFRFCFRIF